MNQSGGCSWPILKMLWQSVANSKLENLYFCPPKPQRAVFCLQKPKPVAFLPKSSPNTSHNPLKMCNCLKVPKISEDGLQNKGKSVATTNEIY